MALKLRPIQDEAEPWLISYADVVTLLLAFFITLFSVANINKRYLDSLARVFGQDKADKTLSLPDLRKQLTDLVFSSKLMEDVEIMLTSRGVEIVVKEKILFEKGKADLGFDSQKLLSRLAELFNRPGIIERRVSVEGHTDSLPIQTARFASNWELSSSRACEVIRFFTAAGINPERMEAIGYADTKKREPDIPKVGNPRNRRVVLVIS